MTVDIIVSPTTTRTYVVPSSVTAAVAESWKRDETMVDDLNRDLVRKLVVDKKVNLNDVYRIHTTPVGLTAAGEVADMFGGTAGREWAAKIINGVQRDAQRQRDRQLDAIGYDPVRYAYFGLTAAGDEDLITTVLRSPIGSTGLSDAEKLQNGLTWSTFDGASSLSRDTYGVHLEPELLAFTASAFAEGVRAVQLAYGEPLLFLENPPLLASGDAALGTSEQNGHVYAVVDSSDTTAVMDLIMIKPGPQVFRRDAKNWTLDEAMLDSLLSATPPPIVALNGSDLKAVMAQIDDTKSQQIAPEADGTAKVGPNLVPKEPAHPMAKKMTGTSTPAKSETKSPAKPMQPTKPRPETEEEPGSKGGAVAASFAQRYGDALAAATARRNTDRRMLRQKYEEDGGHEIPIIAALESVDLRYQREVTKIRAEYMSAATALTAALRAREHELEKIIIPGVMPALVADAVSVHNTTPHQRKAEPLRKYWIRGVGAVKIKWGAPGDFRRCVRQLRKYLGSRAEGYCAKRHKEAVGFWPGDKRNR